MGGGARGRDQSFPGRYCSRITPGWWYLIIPHLKGTAAPPPRVPSSGMRVQLAPNSLLRSSAPLRVLACPHRSLPERAHSKHTWSSMCTHTCIHRLLKVFFQYLSNGSWSCWHVLFYNLLLVQPELSLCVCVLCVSFRSSGLPFETAALKSLEYLSRSKDTVA